MSGNVWEWCLTDYYNPAPDAQKDDLHSANDRVVRGGSWYYGQNGARAAFRYGYAPNVRYLRLGFRVVLSSPI